MANSSCILAWEILWTEDTGGLQSMGVSRVRHDLATKSPTLVKPHHTSQLYIKSILQVWKTRIIIGSESEVAQSCTTLSDPWDCSLPGSSIGIFQATVLEWGAIAFSQ